jgi:Holliday junction resolvase-like predicted endonuclease
MQTKIYDAQSIKMEFDLLAAELRAGLVGEVEYRERRKKLYERAHEAVKSESLRHDEATCFFCQEEATERRAKMDKSVLLPTSNAGEKLRGIRL